MKSFLFIFATLVLFSSVQATPPPRLVLATLYVTHTDPTLPETKLIFYNEGDVEYDTCPGAMQPCKATKWDQLSQKQFEVLRTDAEDAVKQPAEPPPPPGIHCMAVPNTFQYYLVTIRDREVQVAKSATPCGKTEYKNKAALDLKSLMDAELDKLEQ